MALTEEEVKDIKFKHKRLTRERQDHKNILNDYIAEVKLFIKHKQKSSLKSAEEFLGEYWENYHGTKKEIESCISQVKDLKDDENYVNLQTQVNRLRRQAQDELAELEKKPETVIQPAKAEVKVVTNDLPKLEHIKFDGHDLTLFPVYWDNFESTIDKNPNIEDVALKFSHLRKSLVGEASNCIRGLSTTKENYEQAKKNLLQEYGGQGKIRDIFINKLIHIKKPNEGVASMKAFYYDINNGFATLENYGCTADKLQETLVRSFKEKLPGKYKTKIKVEEHRSKVDCLTIKRFLEVLYEQIDINSDTDIPTRPSSDREVTTFTTSDNSRRSQGAQVRKCFYHNSTDHTTWNCRLSIEEKYKIIRDRKACLNCLSLSHFRDNCQNTRRCCKCKGKHHSSICRGNSKQSSHSSNYQSHNSHSRFQPHASHSRGGSLNANAVSFQPNPTVTASSSSDDSASVVLYKTAIGQARTPNGDSVIQILFDEGSKRSFVTEDFVRRHRLKTYGTEYLTIIGFGGHRTQCKLAKVPIIINTRRGPIEIEALMKKTLVNPINQEDWDKCRDFYHIQNLDLANDFKGSHFQVDVLIGLDFCFDFLLETFVIGEDGPRAQLSTLGFIPCGPLYPSLYKQTLKQSSSYSEVPTFFCHDIEESILQDSAFKDELIEKSSSYFGKELQFNDTSEKDHYVKKFTDNITFEKGQYVVPLTWKENHLELPSNLQIAKKRLISVMHTLLNRGKFYNYHMQIQEQVRRGFIEEIPKDQDPWSEEYSHYIPHFPVFTDSETTPMRIVFAANCGSPSLNDCLATGPCLLESLHEILHRFRFHKYALTADIEKAFLSLVLRESDRNYTKFLWFRNGLDTPMMVYRYRTVLFGPTSSPFALNATLKFHIDKYIDQSNEWILSDIKKNIYSDNVISGCSTEEDMINYVKVSHQVLGKGGFNLRKWLTNSEKVMDFVEKENLSASKKVVSVLGIEWDGNTDELGYIRKKIFHDLCTKRNVLAEIASVFDPVGFAAPILVQSKHFFQGLWKAEYQWNQVLTGDLEKEWKQIRADLERIPELKIQRFLGLDREKSVTLHIFSDAALSIGYGTIAYLVQGNSVILIGAKGRVVPSGKKSTNLTTPKVELLANVLGCLYAHWIQQIYKDYFNLSEVHFWTDNEINLYWLNSTKPLKQFVQNRISKILSHSSPKQWHYCPTEENPSDLVSRGCTLNSLLSSDLYWHGPPWLTCPENWPVWNNTKKEVIEVMSTETIPEEESKSLWNILSYDTLDQDFSSYDKLVKSLAYCYRIFTGIVAFKNRVKEDITIERRLLSTIEIKFAENYLLLQIQLHAFPHVFRYLKKQEDRMPAIVRQLDLFIGQDGLLRLAGRINRSSLVTKEVKNPVLLPKNSKDQQNPITKLVIQRFHALIKHSGAEATSVAIRQRFWIPQIRTQVKTVLHKCVPCKKLEGPPFKVPQSPDLPKFRVNGEIYESIGIDCTGHIFIKTENGTEKVYICLFTDCLSRHINLEIVLDLTAEEFVNAFRRHSAVYSIPSLCVTDNANNFLLGGKEITELVSDSEEYAHSQLVDVLESEEVQIEFGNLRVEFRNIPKRSPHFGGFYERLIALAKRVLRKTFSKRLLTYTQLLTVIKECQATLNDRPLTFLNSDPLDLTPICPSELVIGKRVTTLPYKEIPPNFDSDWDKPESIRFLQKSQKACLNEFKQQFITQYLPSLRERHQHNRKDHKTFRETIQRGMVCLIHGEDKRQFWNLGVVEDLLRGKDGEVRAVTLRTARGITNRAIGKLYPLEFSEDTESQFKDTVPTPKTLRRSSRIAARNPTGAASRPLAM